MKLLLHVKHSVSSEKDYLKFVVRDSEPDLEKKLLGLKISTRLSKHYFGWRVDLTSKDYMLVCSTNHRQGCRTAASAHWGPWCSTRGRAPPRPHCGNNCLHSAPRETRPVAGRVCAGLSSPTSGKGFRSRSRSCSPGSTCPCLLRSHLKSSAMK